MSVIESNKLIASFMGLTLGHPELFELRWADQYFDANRNRIGKHLLYHSSYDWLMPVIRKLQSVTEEPEELDDLKQSLWFNDIKDVFIYVVDAIQWYNKQKQ